MNLDIVPEPSEEERAAIVQALAAELEKPAPAPWLEHPESDGGHTVARGRNSAGALRA